MWWVLVALAVLSPAILYGLLLVFVAVFRGRCAACGRRSLKLTNGYRATILVDGRRAPDFWSYYCCEKCGAAFKRHRSEWSRIPPEEAHRP
jgi:hypothetical protein